MGLDCSRSFVDQESYDPLFLNSTFLPFETSGKRMFYSGRLVHNTFEDWIGSSFASVQPTGRSSIPFLSNFPQFPLLAVESGRWPISLLMSPYQNISQSYSIDKNVHMFDNDNGCLKLK